MSNEENLVFLRSELSDMEDEIEYLLEQARAANDLYENALGRHHEVETMIKELSHD